MIKAVLFDIDGVIVNSGKANHYFCNDILKEHGGKELSEEGFEKIKHYTLKQAVEEFFPELEKEQLEEIRKKWSGNYKKYLEHSNLNDGIKESLEFLKEKGIKLGVVTNKSKTTMLEHYNLLHFFDYIVTANDVIEPKPSPEGILKVLKEFKVKPEETIFIGDAIGDLKAGQSAGVKTLIYRSEIENEEFERINEFEEIKKFLGD
ncbi:HAD family hydrolase [Candidatus Micrarchaeota archaeon]|nr:HAD family hydrolase [Candidatus Micrarchaeota archaeon]MBU2476037.1 HAD family hydrolase [Candidatus Micrarchaeota archaeon]